MKKSKKLKLITSLSTVATIGAAVPLTLVGCTTTTTVNTTKVVKATNDAVDITTLPWYKSMTFAVYDETKIINQIKADNDIISEEYPDIWDNIDIDVVLNGKTITITISAKDTSQTYSGALDPWDAKYIGTDTIKIDATSIPESILLTTPENRYTITAESALQPGVTIDLTKADVEVSSSNEKVLEAEWDTEPEAGPEVVLSPKALGDATITINVEYTNSTSGVVITGSTSLDIKVTQDQVVEYTYEDLAELKENDQLIPYQKYRITDFTTIVANQTGQKYEGKVNPAGKQFDLIVTANSTSTFNENAQAEHHVEAGKTDPFASNNLNAWEIKYSFENDDTKYDWADKTNSKGVIYYMKDEFGNECPYDFKNIRYTDSSYQYFTFSQYSGSIVDASLSSTYNVHDNVIKPYYEGTKHSLNTIYFKGKEVYSNTFDNNCHNINFGIYPSGWPSQAYNNIFGSNCSNNTFGYGCQNNTFGSGCTYNSIDSRFQNNTFGSGCTNNTIGNNFWSNTFGNQCSFNTIKNTTANPIQQNNYFNNGVIQLTIDDKVTFKNNGVISNLTPLTISESISNIVIIDGKIVVPKESYEIAPLEFGTIIPGQTASSKLTLNSWYGKVPTADVTWTATQGTLTTQPTITEGDDDTISVTIPQLGGDYTFRLTASVNDVAVESIDVTITVPHSYDYTKTNWTADPQVGVKSSLTLTLTDNGATVTEDVEWEVVNISTSSQLQATITPGTTDEVTIDPTQDGSWNLVLQAKINGVVVFTTPAIAVVVDPA